MQYHIHVDVVRARGKQTWKIEADSEQHARSLYAQGEGELIYEELEADDTSIDSVEQA